MSKLDSPFWNLELGVCTKHMLPSIPCPACLAEPRDPDVITILSQSDLFMLDWEEALNDLSREHNNIQSEKVARKNGMDLDKQTLFKEMQVNIFRIYHPNK